jgi:large subunit ribosomal protein L29
MAKKATTKKKAAAPKGAKAASKADDFRSHSADELSGQLSNLKKEQFNLRFQRATGQQEGVGRVRQVRREIARVKTIMSEKNRAEKTSSAAQA